MASGARKESGADEGPNGRVVVDTDDESGGIFVRGVRPRVIESTRGSPSEGFQEAGDRRRSGQDSPVDVGRSWRRGNQIVLRSNGGSPGRQGAPSPSDGEAADGIE